MSTHPAFVARYEAFRLAATERGWRIWIVAAERTYDQQGALWAKSPTNPDGDGTGNPANNPDTSMGYTFGGWEAIGSWHQQQLDGYSYALDLGWAGCATADMHALAYTYGIRFPYMPREPWHCQPWDGQRFFPALAMMEDDMTPAQFAAAIGAVFDPVKEQAGQPCILIPLIDDTLKEFVNFPFAAAMTYTHQEMKMARLR